MMNGFVYREKFMDKTVEAAAAADLSIQEKIREALSLCHAWKETLLADEKVLELLEKTARCVDSSRAVMIAGGVVEACRWCEEEAGGSCCGAGIENRYSSHLLLANLLLDVTLPQRRGILDSCYFLGERGCCLTIRHVLCVNYMCERLRRDLDPDVLRDLQESSGVELDTGFLLHERLIKITRS